LRPKKNGDLFGAFKNQEMGLAATEKRRSGKTGVLGRDSASEDCEQFGPPAALVEKGPRSGSTPGRDRCSGGVTVGQRGR